MKKIYLLLPLLSTAAIGFSQIDTTSKILDELVVTGQYRPQSLKIRFIK